MLTKDEAVAFLRDVLCITDHESRMNSSKLDFLNHVIVQMYQYVPFHNITFLEQAEAERHRPTDAEIRESMFSGIGGLCYTIHVWLFSLLRVLGYDVYFNHCTMTTSVTYPNNHLIILVKNLVNPDDLFLVDIAVGVPTFKAVCLDFDKESPVFNDSYLEYKYVKHDGKILRMHGDGDFRSKRGFPWDFFFGRFRRFCEFKIDPITEVESIQAGFDDVYTNEDATPFFKNFRAVSFKNSRAVILTNYSLMVENDARKFDITNLAEEREIIKEVLANFPTIPRETVNAAIRNWMLKKSDLQCRDK